MKAVMNLQASMYTLQQSVLKTIALHIIKEN
jgi:hypothetical protein